MCEKRVEICGIGSYHISSPLFAVWIIIDVNVRANIEGRETCGNRKLPHISSVKSRYVVEILICLVTSKYYAEVHLSHSIIKRQFALHFIAFFVSAKAIASSRLGRNYLHCDFASGAYGCASLYGCAPSHRIL